MTHSHPELNQNLNLNLNLPSHPWKRDTTTLPEDQGVEDPKNPMLGLGRRGVTQTVYLTAARPFRGPGPSHGNNSAHSAITAAVEKLSNGEIPIEDLSLTK